MNQRPFIRQYMVRSLAALLLGVALLLTAVPWVRAQESKPTSTPSDTAPPADSNWMPGQRMRRALRRVVTAAQKQETLGFGFLDFGSFFGAFLLNAQNAEESFELTKGTMYAFLAGGDNEAKDIDVEIYRIADGKLIKKDDRVAPTTALVFTPQTTERYKVVLRLKSSGVGGSFCGMAVLCNKGGVTVPAETLYTVSEDCLRKCENLAKTVSTYFRAGTNTWAVYAVILKPEQSAYTDPKPFIKADHAFLASADKNSTNIDLRLLDSTPDKDGNYTSVVEDVEPDAEPAFRHETEAQSYIVEILNKEKAGADKKRSLTVCAILEVKSDKTEPDSGEEVKKTPVTPDDPEPSKELVKADETPAAVRMAGPWEDKAAEQKGTVDILVYADGKIEGKVTNETQKISSPITGKIEKGVIRFSYKYEDRAYTGRGTLSVTKENHLVGTVSFYDGDDMQFGTATVDLAPKSVIPK